MTIIEVTVDWKGIQGFRNVNRTLHLAIVNAIDDAVLETEEYMKKIVPESRKRSPPYGPKYVSERLMRRAQTRLIGSLTRITSGKNTLRASYPLELTYTASYAEHVDKLPTAGTKWSKKGSEGGFIKKTLDFLEAELVRNLNHYVKSTAFNKHINVVVR